MAFPTTSELDPFTGTNGTDLPVYSANWQATPTGGSPLEIQDNAATGTSAGGNNTNSWATSFNADCEIWTVIDTVAAAGNVTLLFARGVQTSSLATVDGYVLRYAPAAGTDTLTIQSVTNGTQTSIGAAFSQEIANGDAIGLQCIGTTLRCWYKASGGSWTELFSRTDSTYTAGGQLALFTTSTGIRFGSFGGGDYIPPSQNLVCSRFDNTNTFFSSTVSLGAVTLTPSLFTNSNVFYSSTVSVGAINLTASLFTNSNTLYAPSISVGAVSLSPSLFTNANTFYAATVSQGGSLQTLTPSLFTNTNAFYAAVVSASKTLQPSLYSNTNTFYAHTVNASYTIAPSLFNNSNQFFSANVTVGAVNISPALFTNSNTFYNHVVNVAGGPSTLLPSLLTNTNVFYTHAISANYTLTASRYNNSNTFYSPTVTSNYLLTVSRFDNTNQFFSATLIADQLLLAGLFSNASVFYYAVVVNGGHDQYPLAGMLESYPLADGQQYPLTGIKQTYSLG